MPIRIALDAMGGDAAPGVIVEGAVHAARRHPDDLHVILFGPEAAVREALQPLSADDLPITIADAPEVIGMQEAPAQAVKGKPNASIPRALGAVKAGQADAFISAGNTGAVMAAALFILGRLPGVQRPSVIGFYPTTTSFCIVLDVGTNVDCKPEHLVQFARMGSIYAEHVLGRPDPIVGLLNVGEEPGKGNEQAKAAFDLLQASGGLNFRGNIEGRDVLHHAADVVVCDGFIGNIILKLGESMATALPALVRRQVQAQSLTAEEAQVVKTVLGGVLRPFDYQSYGAAPLLGVGGPVLISHGGSSALAIERALGVARTVVEQDVAGKIAAALAD